MSESYIIFARDLDGAGGAHSLARRLDSFIQLFRNLKIDISSRGPYCVSMGRWEGVTGNNTPTTMVRRVRAAALLLVLVDSSTVAFSTESWCSRSRSPSRIWMSADADVPRRPLKQSAAAEIALKIGLNIAPKDSTDKNYLNEGKKKKGGRKVNHAAPVISWGRGMERFFWGENFSEAIPSRGRSSTNKMAMHRISNKEYFPLVLLRGALSAESLAWALSLAAASSHTVVADP